MAQWWRGLLGESLGKKLLLVGLAILIIAGLTAVIYNSSEPAAQVESSPDYRQDYGQRPVGNVQAAPQILNLSIHRHSDNTYGLEVEVSNLIFDQENFGGTHRENFGHGRVLVDGQPVAWLRQLDYELADLSVGKRTITVELLSNDHQQLVVDDVPITASIALNVGSDDFVQLLDEQTIEQRALDKHVH